MSSSSSSSPSSSSSYSPDSSMTKPLSIGAVQKLPPLKNVVWEDYPEGVADRSDSPEQSSLVLELHWVDPKVVGFTSTFLDGASISAFLGKYPILKSDTDERIIGVERWKMTDTICIGQSPSEGPFNFLYSCVFSNLHVVILFNDFTMGILQTLNVAPS